MFSAAPIDDAFGMTQTEGITAEPATPRARRRWPEWIGYAAVVWSLAYGLAGLYWALGGGGFPFGHSVAAANAGALLVGLPPRATGLAIAVLGLLTAALAVVLTRRPLAVPRPVPLVVGWLLSAFMILVVADGRVLMSLAYGLMLNADQFTWEVVNQLVCILGGIIWGATTLAYQRRTRGTCPYCGRAHDRGEEAGAEFPPVSRAAKVITCIAVAAPLVYVIPRWLWAAGVPFGVTPRFFDTLKLDKPAAQVLELALGSMAIGGGLLTIALIRPWGEVFPRWIPFLGKRRVAPMAAVIPAGLVGIALTVGGLSIDRGILSMALGITPDTVDLSGNWGAWAGGPAFLVWGTALLGSTVAYYLRRRGRCGYCRRI
jgi:hypothetical protein